MLENYSIELEVSTRHFRDVPAQARPRTRAGPCSAPCRDPKHDTALVFVSCRHGPKYFMSCRASGCAKRPCRAFWVMPKDYTMICPQMARPKSQLYLREKDKEKS
jgi:hypothetical protein